MEQTILTKDQETVLALVGKEETLASYYLSGGTALAAFYLQHRYSDDLDFFSQTPTDPMILEAFMAKLKEAVKAREVRFEKIHDRRLFFFDTPHGELKIEFTHYPFPPLEDPHLDRHVRIDSLRDVAAGKLMALLDRFDPKDFVDLYFLLQTGTLEQMRGDTEKKFGLKISPLFLGGEFAKVSRIETLPRSARTQTDRL